MDRERSGAGLLWMLLATTLFAIMTIAARLGSRDASWTLVAASRSGVGLLVAWGVASARGCSLRIERPRLAWARSLCGTAAMACTFFTLGAPAIAVGDIATIRGLTPILIAVLGAVLLREAPGRRIFVALPLAFVGLAIVVRPQLELAGHLAALAFAGAALSAVAMLFLRRLGPTEQPEAVAFHFMAVSFGFLLVAAAVDFRLPSLGSVGWIALAGLTGGTAQLAVTRAYALDVAARVGAVGYLGILITQLLAEWFLGESVDAHQRVGAVLVIVAGLVLAGAAWRDRRRRMASAPAASVQARAADGPPGSATSRG
jgi:drug/metabolite transporter (DMT)-like permease